MSNNTFTGHFRVEGDVDIDDLRSIINDFTGLDIQDIEEYWYDNKMITTFTISADIDDGDYHNYFVSLSEDIANAGYDNHLDDILCNVG